MSTDLLGIHHVTAITSSAEKNYQFYAGVLGMRLVKKQLTKMTFTPTIPSSQMMRETRVQI